MSMNTRIAEDIRRQVLDLLAKDNNYSHNEAIICAALEEVGHFISRDRLRSELCWLQEQGLVQVDIIGTTIYVAKLTSRGLDVAEGRATVPGVKRPGLRD